METFVKIVKLITFFMKDIVLKIVQLNIINPLDLVPHVTPDVIPVPTQLLVTLVLMDYIYLMVFVMILAHPHLSILPENVIYVTKTPIVVLVKTKIPVQPVQLTIIYTTDSV